MVDTEYLALGNGLWGIQVPYTMTSRDPERSNWWPQYDQSPISRKQLEMPFSNNR